MFFSVINLVSIYYWTNTCNPNPPLSVVPDQRLTLFSTSLFGYITTDKMVRRLIRIGVRRVMSAKRKTEIPSTRKPPEYQFLLPHHH